MKYTKQTFEMLSQPTVFYCSHVWILTVQEYVYRETLSSPPRVSDTDNPTDEKLCLPSDIEASLFTRFCFQSTKTIDNVKEIVDAKCKPLFKLEAMLKRLYCYYTGSVRYTLLYFRDNTKNSKTFGAKYEKKCALFS